MRNKLISALLLWLASTALYGQDSKIQSAEGARGKYVYKSEIYKYDQLQPFFKLYPEAESSYNKAKSRLKTGKILGYVSLASLGSSVIIAFARDRSNCDNFCGGPVDGYMYISALLVFPITGLLGSISHFRGKDLQQKSIRQFNEVSMTYVPINSVSSQYEIEIMTVGLGLGTKMKF